MLTTAVSSTPAPQPAASKAVERPAESAPESKRETVTRAPSEPSKPSQYRLAYDKERSRIFIQVIDPDTGKEILRFPPEELVRFIDKSIDKNSAGASTGLFVDRSV